MGLSVDRRGVHERRSGGAKGSRPKITRHQRPPASCRGGAGYGNTNVSDTPLVSIGVPVYNGERFLARTLQSLLAQTYTNLEIIICDNASTDGTEAICREFAARDSRIRYL